MRALIIAALALSGCAHWTRVGQVECTSSPAPPHTRVECRAPGRPETARAMVVGEPGAQLVGEVRVQIRAR